jgi:hypothetical protein
LQFSELLRSDEVRLKMKISDTEDSAPHGVGSALVRAAPTAVKSIAQATQVAPSRIVQTLREYAVLYRLPSPEDSEPAYLDVSFELPVPLGNMADKAGATYFRTYGYTDLPFDRLRAEFERTQRLPVTDGDASCALALRALERHTGIPNMHIKCVVHKGSNMVDDVMMPFDEFINDYNHFVHSLQDADHMRKWRECVRSVISRRFRYKKRAPRPLYVQRIVNWLDISLPPSSNTTRLRRAIIMALLNGNPWEFGALEHNCTGCCIDEVDCLNKFTSFFTSVTSAVPPYEYPKHGLACWSLVIGSYFSKALAL